MRFSGWARIQYDTHLYREKLGHTERPQGCTHTDEKPHEDTARRQPSMRLGERPQKKSNLLTP